MLKAAIDEYQREMRAAGRAFLTDGNKLLVGRIEITAWPALDAPVIERLRLDFPADRELYEPAPILMLFQCVWGEALVWWPLWQRAGAALQSRGRYSETVAGVVFQTGLADDDVWRCQFWAKSPP